MARGKSIIYDKTLFGSIYEVARYIALKEKEAEGEISQLKCHPAFDLTPEITGFTVIRQIYHAKSSLPSMKAVYDFSYIEDGKMVVEDVKAHGDILRRSKKGKTSRAWLLEESFLIKLKFFLWLKDPEDWDFRIPLVTKEEVQRARRRVGGTN